MRNKLNCINCIGKYVISMDNNTIQVAKVIGAPTFDIMRVSGGMMVCDFTKSSKNVIFTSETKVCEISKDEYKVLKELFNRQSYSGFKKFALNLY